MADKRLTHCPETGVSLENIDPRKQAYRLWPSLDANKLPNTEAGKRYRQLLDEAELRDAEAEEKRVRERQQKRPS